MAEQLTYEKYLQVSKLLDCQYELSSEDGAKKPAHDEHMFIIIHQVFELWFKQILHDMDSLSEILETAVPGDTNDRILVSRLSRIIEILRLIIGNFTIMETMTPLDFLDFRGYLSPASGFQSLQFRLIENKWGLKEENRGKYNQKSYKVCFQTENEKRKLDASLDSPSMFQRFEKWLERTPGLEGETFAKKFMSGAKAWLEADYEAAILDEEDPDRKAEKLNECNKQKDIFHAVVDEQEYQKSLDDGHRRLSRKAFLGALMINLYRDLRDFQQPHQILRLLVDIDAWITKWRCHHVLMVHRMIGKKTGTGGSSGVDYLRTTWSDQYRVYLDLFNMSAYLLPTQYIPQCSWLAKREEQVYRRNQQPET